MPRRSSQTAASVGTLVALSPGRRVPWLKRHRDAWTSTFVRGLADEVTHLTRVRLRDADILARALAWLMPRVRDEEARARGWRARGHVAALDGRYAEARTAYVRALRGFVRARQPVEAAITRSGALQVLIYLGKYREAMAWARQARTQFARAGDTLRLARLETNVANVLHRHDRFEDALARYRAALSTFERGAHRRDQAITLRNMAVCYIGLNRFEPAVQAYEHSRLLAEDEGLLGLVAEVDYNIAYLHYLRGDYHTALRLYDEARTRCRRVDDRYHAALCDLDQAELALELNLTDEGVALAASAYEQFSALGLNYERAKARVNQGIAAQRRLDWSTAIAHYRRARAIFVVEDNAVWTALLDTYLAYCRIEQGRPADGEALGRRALRRFTAMPFSDRRALAHYVLARAALAQNELAAARRRCRQALAELRNHPVPALAYRVWHLLGRIDARAGRLRAAQHAFEQAHVHVEALRAHLTTDSLKVAFLVDKLAVYESLVRTALHLAPDELGPPFEYMEQAKARTLVEHLSEVAARSGVSVSADVALAAAYRQRDSATPDRVTPVRAASGGLGPNRSVLALRAQAQRQEATLRRLERQRRPSGPPPQTSERMLSQLQATLGPREHLVEYYVAEGRLLGWTVNRQQATVSDLGDVAPALRALRFLQFQLAHCRWHLHDRPSDPAPALAHLRALHGLLLEPLLPQLADADHVVFVPHGALHAVPFGAMFDGRSFVGDRTTWSVAPSSAVYVQASRRLPSVHRHSLVLGVPDPRAPRITDEVRRVARAFPDATVLEGASATVGVFREAAKEARILHLAAHGQFRSDNADYSSIQLVDGPMTLRDIESLQLDADLVALSGCGTGRLVVTAGDEVFGLARGLLSAGARSLLLALWDISDAATTLYMDGFYSALEQGVSLAGSAQSAAATVRASYPHPYFWAPFVLVGCHDKLQISLEDPIFRRAGQTH